MMDGTIEVEPDDLRVLAAAYADGDIPKVWTAAHAANRLVEAFDVLKRTPGRWGPKMFGNGWPQIVRDFAELIDQDKLDEAIRTGQARTAESLFEMLEDETQAILRGDADAELRRPKLPEPDEASRADEALSWGMEHMQGASLQAHALHFWAACTAFNWKAAPILRKRAVAADAMIAYAIDKGKRDIARRWAASANRCLVGANGREDAMLCRYGAFDGAKAEIAAMPKLRRGDVMPDRVFTKQWLDVNRKKGAALLAASLHKAGISVR